jgi:TniB protein
MSKTREDYSKMSDDKRCTMVERIFVKYPRLDEIRDKIKHCHEYSKISAEPECMFIGGFSGTGKTTLQDYYAEAYPRTVYEEGTIVPVLAGRVPERANNKTLVTELLISMGDPAAESGTAYNQTTRFRKFLKECGTELIFLDEFQHFVDKDSVKVLKNVSDWLKNLIDQTRLPIIMCGMPYAASVLDAPGNEQLQRRFSVRASLDPFGWNTNEEKKEFRAFLKALDDQLPFPQPSRLAEKIMAFRIYCATNGRVGKIMKVVRRATELAIKQSLEKLDLDVFEKAYEDRLRDVHPDRNNPFSEDLNKLKPIPFKEYVPNFGVTKRGAKSEGDDDEKASDVLKKR